MGQSKEFTTNTTSLSENNGTDSDIPYYLRYPTPIFDRNELHKTTAPLLNLSSFDGNSTENTISYIAKSIIFDWNFDKKCKKNKEKQQILGENKANE